MLFRSKSRIRVSRTDRGHTAQIAFCRTTFLSTDLSDVRVPLVSRVYYSEALVLAKQNDTQ